MSGIKRVVFTELFWATLEPLRTHPRYLSIRNQIDEMLYRRSLGPSRMNGRDKPFSATGDLAGIWHWPCSRNPDVVLFYTVDGDTVTLAMMGSHHDYAHSGKNRSASGRTARRIHSAVATGHVATPNWKSLYWKVPADVVNHPYLHEMSKDAAVGILEALDRELDNAAIYRRETGREILDEPEEVFDAWLEAVSRARAAVVEAMQRNLSTPELTLKLIRERRDSAFAP